MEDARANETRRTMKNIAVRLSAPDEPLTLTEAQTLAAIATADRLTEALTLLGDIAARLTRLELYVASHLPDYDAETRRMILAAGQPATGQAAAGPAPEAGQNGERHA